MRTKLSRFGVLVFTTLFACAAAAQSKSVQSDKFKTTIQEQIRKNSDMPVPKGSWGDFMKVNLLNPADARAFYYVEGVNYRNLSAQCLAYSVKFLEEGMADEAKEMYNRANNYYKVSLVPFKTTETVKSNAKVGKITDPFSVSGNFLKTNYNEIANDPRVCILADILYNASNAAARPAFRDAGKSVCGFAFRLVLQAAFETGKISETLAKMNSGFLIPDVLKWLDETFQAAEFKDNLAKLMDMFQSAELRDKVFRGGKSANFRAVVNMLGEAGSSGRLSERLIIYLQRNCKDFTAIQPDAKEK